MLIIIIDDLLVLRRRDFDKVFSRISFKRFEHCYIHLYGCMKINQNIYVYI